MLYQWIVRDIECRDCTSAGASNERSREREPAFPFALRRPFVPFILEAARSVGSAVKLGIGNNLQDHPTELGNHRVGGSHRVMEVRILAACVRAWPALPVSVFPGRIKASSLPHVGVFVASFNPVSLQQIDIAHGLINIITTVG
ncbi:unnamed protein product [Vitrella brassicaformis CCMP3155]|uniref:Uncharacterized protein n=1 Tax=Vitrella brassicaformis (strain CCMP3155) TaxID=1169540 RepID=A0A0G4EB60_VITBC|nr:unnamed protein product [Vitrella brassicaformis CCMP3155]|eukprot:CEL92479.1 unnamed protein product [Vitrella brassicaformis CCMP3155]